MGTISDILFKAKSAAETVGSKAGELAEATKIYIEIAAIESEIEKLYAFVGEAYVDSVSTGQPMVLYDEAIAQIKEKKAKITELKAKLVGLKKIKICPGCQTESDIDAEYCKKCGKKL